MCVRVNTRILKHTDADPSRKYTSFTGKGQPDRKFMNFTAGHEAVLPHMPGRSDTCVRESPGTCQGIFPDMSRNPAETSRNRSVKRLQKQLKNTDFLKCMIFGHRCLISCQHIMIFPKNASFDPPIYILISSRKIKV